MTDAEENPGLAVERAVHRSLQLAGTWLAWDGRPSVSNDGSRVYTPHKVIRRLADHLIDHIAEIEAMLAGQPTIPDAWGASLTTLESDWARFTEADLREAQQRLERLGQTFVLRLQAAGPAEWDRPRDDHWTLREIAHHLDSTYYADQIGDLGDS